MRHVTTAVGILFALTACEADPNLAGPGAATLALSVAGDDAACGADCPAPHVTSDGASCAPAADINMKVDMGLTFVDGMTPDEMLDLFIALLILDECYDVNDGFITTPRCQTIFEQWNEAMVNEDVDCTQTTAGEAAQNAPSLLTVNDANGGGHTIEVLGFTPRQGGGGTLQVRDPEDPEHPQDWSVGKDGTLTDQNGDEWTPNGGYRCKRK